MDSVEKGIVGVFVAIVALMVCGLIASAYLGDSYKQACTERNGVTVYNGKHYECFVK